jgi:hypothetical protein
MIGALQRLYCAAGALEPPVRPDRDEARRWAEEELSKPKYPDAQPSWLEQAWQDFLDWLASLGNDSPAPGSEIAVPIIIALAIVLIVVAIVVVRPRLNARRKKPASDVFGSDTVADAAVYRQRAAAAADDGDWRAAVVEQFRAVVRSAEERDVIEARPGRTADEAALQLGSAFPTAKLRLTDAAGIFDAVLYGGMPSDRSAFEAVRALDSELLGTVPEFTPTAVHGFAVPR